MKMLNKSFAVLFLFCIILIGCPPTPLPKVADPSPVTPTDTSFCQLGCDYLQTLTGRDGKPGCEEARPLVMPDHSIVSCVSFCQETQNNGRNLYPSCWLKVKKCEEIEEYRLKATSCQ